MQNWKAGVHKVNITPAEPIRLAGFGGRKTPSEGVLQDIHVRALSLEDEAGAVSVILSTDLLGFSRQMADEIGERVEKEFGITREHLILNASHNHSAPVTSELLLIYYDLTPDEADVIERYSVWLVEQIVSVIGASLENRVPVELGFGQGFAGFGVNRRRTRGGISRSRPAPVDHDVPVLSVRTADGKQLAVVFGYACHTTSSASQLIHGDYAGFAAVGLEEVYPETTALFLTGCGGDINPLPRFRPGLSETYGLLLCTAVRDVLEGALESVEGPLQVAYKEVQLHYQTPPTQAALEAALPESREIRRREIEHALSVLQRDGALMTSSPFPVQVWKFGKTFTWIGLSGEPVVDFSLRFKATYGWDNTWVTGYNNELLAYIPSRRISAEGCYEGGTGMMEYGLPAPFVPEVEDVIADGVEELVQSLR
jgi:neutral ceramidase